MTVHLENPLSTLRDLDIRAAQAESATWQGHQALRLENGLALLADQRAVDASVELFIGVDGPAYSGVAFRLPDTLNYELAYAVPHVSGQWDALQYDPVFHGSNTWQLYHGPYYQRAAEVPTGQWFQLKVTFCGERATISVDGQPPLAIGRLVHPAIAGRIGLWTYRPAYFRDLTISPCGSGDVPHGEMPGIPKGAVEAWFAEGFGVVTCEANGVLNLNRFLPASLGQIRLSRRFEISEQSELAFEFGFSDALSLELDGQSIFEGENKFTGFADRAARGYVESGAHDVRKTLTAGTHHLVAELQVNEGFGWGLTLAARGKGLRWLPAELG